MYSQNYMLIDLPTVAIKTWELEEGTKLHLASQKHANVAMTGRNIDNGKPLLVEEEEEDNIEAFPF